MRDNGGMTPELLSLVLLLAEKTPEAKDVKAGYANGPFKRRYFPCL